MTTEELEQRIQGIRDVLAVFRGGISLDDQKFLLDQYDALLIVNTTLRTELDDLKSSTRFLVEPSDHHDGDDGPSVD